MLTNYSQRCVWGYCMSVTSTKVAFFCIIDSSATKKISSFKTQKPRMGFYPSEAFAYVVAIATYHITLLILRKLKLGEARLDKNVIPCKALLHV